MLDFFKFYSFRLELLVRSTQISRGIGFSFRGRYEFDLNEFLNLKLF